MPTVLPRDVRTRSEELFARERVLDWHVRKPHSAL